MNGVATTVSKGTDKREQAVALTVSTLASFIVPFMTSSSTVSLPAIARQFSISGVALSWIVTSFILASAMFLVPFSRAADIYGRKRIFLTGLLLFSPASLLCGLSVTIEMLIVLRFVQGIAAAMMFGTGVSILISVYPPERRGKALGINAAAVYCGLLAGPALGGVMTHYLGWQSIFIFSSLLSLFLAAYTGLALRGEWTQGSRERFDVAGSIVYCIALVCLMYGCSVLPSKQGVLFAVIGMSALAAFWRMELDAVSPVFNTRLFMDNRVFAFSNLTALVNYSATFATSFLISLYLQYVKGCDVAHAGFVMLVQPLVQALLSPACGRLSDRIEPRTLSSIGMAVCCAGLVSLVFCTAQTPVGSIIVRLAVLGTGFALFGSPNTNAVMSSVEKRYYGIASGTLGTMRLSGQMVSMAIITVVLVMHIGKAKISPENFPLFLRSMRISFVIFSALCFAGVFTSLARGRIRAG
jgi:EmrB/QacA subfamily drug resistance transporter